MIVVVYQDNAVVAETTCYLIPTGADWAVWDDVNGVLSFMTDVDVIENARENEALLGDEFGRRLPPDPTAEEAWAYVNALWEGDPGGRGRRSASRRAPPGSRSGRRGRSRPRRAGALLRVRAAACGRGRLGSGPAYYTRRRRGAGRFPANRDTSGHLSSSSRAAIEVSTRKVRQPAVGQPDSWDT